MQLSDILTQMYYTQNFPKPQSFPSLPFPIPSESPPLPIHSLNPKSPTTLLIPQHSHQRTNPRPRRPSRQPLPQQLHSSLLPFLVTLQDLLAPPRIRHSAFHKLDIVDRLVCERNSHFKRRRGGRKHAPPNCLVQISMDSSARALKICSRSSVRGFGLCGDGFLEGRDEVRSLGVHGAQDVDGEVVHVFG